MRTYFSKNPCISINKGESSVLVFPQIADQHSHVYVLIWYPKQIDTHKLKNSKTCHAYNRCSHTTNMHHCSHPKILLHIHWTQVLIEILCDHWNPARQEVFTILHIGRGVSCLMTMLREAHEYKHIRAYLQQSITVRMCTRRNI